MHLDRRPFGFGFEGFDARAWVAPVFFEHALRVRELPDVRAAKVRVAAVRGERAEHAGVRHREMERAETARRFADDGAPAFFRDGRVGAIDEADRVADRVRRVGAAADRVDVLRTAQAIVAVDDRDEHGRHLAGPYEAVGPLHDVGFPGPRGNERSDVARVPVQHVDDRVTRGALRVEARRRVDRERPHRRITKRVAVQRRRVDEVQAHVARESEEPSEFRGCHEGVYTSVRGRSRRSLRSPHRTPRARCDSKSR